MRTHHSLVVSRYVRFALAYACCISAIVCPPSALAQDAAPKLVATDSGGFSYGASVLVFGDDGRCSVYTGAQPLIQHASIACGLNGYTTSNAFVRSSVTRGVGSFEYTGRLSPVHDVTFTLRASAQDNRVRLALTRIGTWPAEAAWCSYQFVVPVSAYGGTQAMADGKAVLMPADKPADPQIVSGAKQLLLGGDDPRTRLELTSTQGIVVVDARQWGTPGYQISIGLESAAIIEMALPPGDAAQLRPRLCASQLGYSSAGLKEISMEWPRGTPRPPDRVTVVDAAGTALVTRRFGPTVRLDYAQNDYASLDLSPIQTPGDYRVECEFGEQRNITIKPTLFDDAVWVPTLARFIPWQMCHADVSFADGLLPNLPACHMDDGQRVPANLGHVIDGFYSYESDLTPYAAGAMIPLASGGWHDAGDYDLNVHAQGYSTWKMALTFEEFGVTHDSTTVDLAAQKVVCGQGDGVPDILQQVQWGAVWLLSMQQADGLVYPGVCCRPGGQYTADVLPEKLSDGKPGTGDERYVYVDYQSDSQLAQVISLAAVARVLKDADPALAGRCLEAAKQAYAYFDTHPVSCRTNTYFDKRAEDGLDGAHAAALAELFMTTADDSYMRRLIGLADKIAKSKVTWPAAYATSTGNWWYAPTVLARLLPQVEDAALKQAILTLCGNAVAEQTSQSSARPWPFMWWHLLDWGSSGHALGRTFDAYYLEKAVPGSFTLERTQREMLWILGYHPLSDVTFVCGIAPNDPKYVYNGRLHGRYGDKAASVPGAVVPGMSGAGRGGLVAYNDVHGNYYHNEACIYTAADYLFAVHALKKAGY
jgi:hypothetical protein